MKSPIARTLTILFLILVNVGCDQVSKTIVRKEIEYHDSIKFMDDHVTLTKIENSGAFLSFGDNLSFPFKVLLLSILPMLALLFGCVYLFTKTNMSTMVLIGFCFAIGGGIGNLFDRIIYGSVTDFVHIDFILFQTGIFNLADVSIMTGMIMILLSSFFNPPQSKISL